MTLNPKLTVVIPMYDHLEQVTRCFRTLRETSDPAITEILVQDDASPTFNALNTFGPQIAERNDYNQGFGGNCNRGAKRARGGVVMFINQDIYAAPESAGWDQRLLQTFDENPMVGIIGPTLLFPDGSVQSVGGQFDHAKQPYHVALGAQNPDWEPIATPRFVSWVTGAAFAVKIGLFNKLGGFDAAYGRGYFEDVDFCVMAQHYEGVKVWHEARIRFTHEVGSTGGNPAFAKNALAFKRRWVDPGVVTADVSVIKEHFWA